MVTVKIPWTIGDGNIVLDIDGGDVRISSDVQNFDTERSQQLTFRTTGGNNVDTKVLTVIQKGFDLTFLRDSEQKILKDRDGKILTEKQ